MNQQKVKRLTSEQKERILRDMWIKHDGRWFLKVADRYGHDVAIELNNEVMLSFARFEVKRAAAELGYSEIKNIHELLEVIQAMADVTFPEDFSNIEFRIKDESTIVSKVEGCIIYHNIEKSGYVDSHKCTSRIRCGEWIRALDLKGEAISMDNTDTCKGACEIIYSISW